MRFVVMGIAIVALAASAARAEGLDAFLKLNDPKDKTTVTTPVAKPAGPQKTATGTQTKAPGIQGDPIPGADVTAECSPYCAGHKASATQGGGQ